MITIINKNYQSLFKLLYEYSKQKSYRNGNMQIQKFKPAVGYFYKIEHKEAKMSQKGKFEHKIDIDENTKK